MKKVLIPKWMELLSLVENGLIYSDVAKQSTGSVQYNSCLLKRLSDLNLLNHKRSGVSNIITLTTRGKNIKTAILIIKNELCEVRE